jgi:hypothetical protein
VKVCSRAWVVPLALIAMLEFSAGSALATTPVSGQSSHAEVTVPQAAPTPSLRGVSCPANNDCEAVGGYDSVHSIDGPLAELWNGTGWAVQPTTALGEEGLRGVSCASPVACLAVGSEGSWVWNGTVWSVPSSPSDYQAVSCPGANVCEAVGGPNAVGLNGTTWSEQQIVVPASAIYTYLTGVSCVTNDHCEAVGEYSSKGNQYYHTLAEVWDGTTWTIQSTPTPSTYTGAFAPAVSCTAIDVCMAVFSTLAEEWNGSTWKVQTLPGRSLAQAVSCPTSHFCIAVGGDGETLAEIWHGSSWTVQHTPSPNGSGGPTYGDSLTSVSCYSSSSCVAVGDRVKKTKKGGVPFAFSESWNGKYWAFKDVPRG